MSPCEPGIWLQIGLTNIWNLWLSRAPPGFPLKTAVQDMLESVEHYRRELTLGFYSAPRIATYRFSYQLRSAPLVRPLFLLLTALISPLHCLESHHSFGTYGALLRHSKTQFVAYGLGKLDSGLVVLPWPFVHRGTTFSL